MLKRLLITILSISLLAALLLPAAIAASNEYNTDANGVALEGYDPVAYQTQGQAVRGDTNIRATHNEVTYYFANADDRTKFLEEPDRYAPQYGGYCAYSAAHSQKLKGDPTAFKVVDGKLYLTANHAALEKFATDTPRHISKADEIWARIKARRVSSGG